VRWASCQTKGLARVWAVDRNQRAPNLLQALLERTAARFFLRQAVAADVEIDD
jgi:hypothetical protein